MQDTICFLSISLFLLFQGLSHCSSVSGARRTTLLSTVGPLVACAGSLRSTVLHKLLKYEPCWRKPSTFCSLLLFTPSFSIKMVQIALSRAELSQVAVVDTFVVAADSPAPRIDPLRHSTAWHFDIDVNKRGFSEPHVLGEQWIRNCPVFQREQKHLVLHKIFCTMATFSTKLEKVFAWSPKLRQAFLCANLLLVAVRFVSKSGWPNCVIEKTWKNVPGIESLNKKVFIPRLPGLVKQIGKVNVMSFDATVIFYSNLNKAPLLFDWNESG